MTPHAKHIFLGIALLPLLAGACATQKEARKPAEVEIGEPVGHVDLRNQLEAALATKDPHERARRLEALRERLPEGLDVRGYISGVLAQTYAEVGDLERMAQAARGAPIQNDLATADLLNAMAYAYAEDGSNLTEAYVRVQQAVQILELLDGGAQAGSSHARAQLLLRRGAFLDTLGWVQHRLGEHEQALASLEEAAGLFDNAEIRFHMGQVLLALGRLPEAAGSFAQAVALEGPGAEEARAALSGIEGVDGDRLIEKARSGLRQATP